MKGRIEHGAPEDMLRAYVCDKLCQYPFICDSQAELDYCCNSCLMNKVTISVYNKEGIEWPVD